MKIVVNQKYIVLSEYVHSIPERFEQEGSVIYKARNEIRVFDVNDQRINVKRFKIPLLLNRFVYTFFRKPKAQRSFEYANRLNEMGIGTPQPVAYILIKKRGLLHYSYFISYQADYNRNMYEFGTGGTNGREHILKAFAGFTVAIHEKGVLHKDYSPGNILFREENGVTDFCIVDLNRMQFGEVPVLKGCANLVRLWGQQPFFELVVREYATLRHADPEQCLQYAIQARRKFWRQYTRKHPLPFPDFDTL
jgi:serine/threonine protein kinase